MKNIYIGDIHGLDVWKQIIDTHQDFNNVVFIGDYLDSYDIPPQDQLKNFQEIIEFKKNNMDKVHLLIGNHDIHYFPYINDTATSGYQPGMRFAYQQVIEENHHLFKMVTMVSNNLCSHAGISQMFLDDNGFKDGDNVVDFINDLFKYKPNTFLFGQKEGWFVSPYGDDPFQSPLWIRPKSLMKNNKNSFLKKRFKQIVGHTVQDSIDIKGKATGGRYFFIDTLPIKQYLIEEDNEFRIGFVK